MGTFDYFDRKPYKVGGGGEVTYNCYQIPFGYVFELESLFTYDFEIETEFKYIFEKEV